MEPGVDLWKEGYRHTITLRQLEDLLTRIIDQDGRVRASELECHYPSLEFIGALTLPCSGRPNTELCCEGSVILAIDLGRSTRCYPARRSPRSDSI